MRLGGRVPGQPALPPMRLKIGKKYDRNRMSAREELHLLLDRIPESELPTMQKLLRSLVDPVELAILTAPEDDEPESDEEKAAVAAALADPAPDIPFEDIQRVH